VSLSPSSI